MCISHSGISPQRPQRSGQRQHSSLSHFSAEQEHITHTHKHTLHSEIWCKTAKGCMNAWCHPRGNKERIQTKSGTADLQFTSESLKKQTNNSLHSAILLHSAHSLVRRLEKRKCYFNFCFLLCTLKVFSHGFRSDHHQAERLSKFPVNEN